MPFEGTTQTRGAPSKTNMTQVLAETIIMVALSSALYMIKLFTFPQGGSITLGSMTPIFVLSFRRGPKVGMVAGACLGLIIVVIEPFIYNPFQFLLDYPLAFGALGIACLLRSWPLIGVGVGIGGRFVCHFLSGVLYFRSFTPVGQSYIVYSATYNASYLLPELAISAVVVFILARRHILTA